jgi:hypothetical protein
MSEQKGNGLKMKKMSRITCCVFALLFVAGCGLNAESERTPTSVSNIDRILTDDLGHYTFFVQHDSENGKVGRLKIHCHEEDVSVLRDIAEDEPIRVEYRCRVPNSTGFVQCREIPQNFSVWYVSASSLTIHLHSAKEINGAGWDHGKFGKGRATGLE